MPWLYSTKARYLARIHARTCMLVHMDVRTCALPVAFTPTAEHTPDEKMHGRTLSVASAP